MKIAQIAPLYESVPPRCYGGTERVVHWITERLVELGHEVTLFASGDSISGARLVSPVKRSLRTDNQVVDYLAPHFTLMEMVEDEAPNFDVIHSHIDYLYYPLMKRNPNSYLTTLHGRLDIPELQALYRKYNQLPLISISDSQRKPVPFANWKKTIYHGLPLHLFKFNPEGGKYLTFVGRISPEKRIDRAIKIAVNADIPFRFAAKIDKVDREYFELKIKHLLKHPLVEFLGEINDMEKQELYGNALGLLYPIDWPEPFGLAMIEALACGTPVIAYRNGSVPEVINDGITGFIVNSQEEAVAAVKKLPQLSRFKCRQIFEQRFSVQRMVNDYLSVYESIQKSDREKIMSLPNLI